MTLTTFESREKRRIAVPYWGDLEVNFVEIPHIEDPRKEQIAHVEAASEYLEKNYHKFDKIIIDSWFISLAVIRKNIISEKIFQLVQSNPCFEPDNYEEFWKAELFNLLPITPMNRIVVSKSLADLFRGKYNKDYQCVPLFIDEIYLKSKFKVREAQVLKLVSSSVTFNIKSKGLNFLLEQLEEFRDFNFQLTLICLDEIKDDLSKYSFPIKIVKAKNPQEMSRELCRHDVYINTSTNEAFCLALAEAMAIGMPSIALDSIGNREYMNGDNAIFVKEKETFLSGLASLKSLEFRQLLCKKAKESMKTYTLKNTVSDLKRIINI